MKLTQGQIIVGSLVIVGFGVTLFFTSTAKGKELWGNWFGGMTRTEADKILGGTPSSYGDDFVIAWAKARKKEQVFFTVGGKKYHTTTGKAM